MLTSIAARASDPHLASLCASYLTGHAEAGLRLSPVEARAALEDPLRTLRRHPDSRRRHAIWKKLAAYLGIVESQIVDAHLQLGSDPLPHVDPDRAGDVRLSLLQLERLHADLNQWSDPMTPLRHVLVGAADITNFLEGRIAAAHASHRALRAAQAERTARLGESLRDTELRRVREIEAWRARQKSRPTAREWLFGPDSNLATGERLGVLTGFVAFGSAVTSVVDKFVPGLSPLVSAAGFSGGWFVIRQRLYSAVERMKIGWRAFFQRQEDLHELDRLHALERDGVRATLQMDHLREMVAFLHGPREPGAMIYLSYSIDLPVTPQKKFGRAPQISGDQILEALLASASPVAAGRVVQLHHVLRLADGVPELLTFLLERENAAANDLFLTMSFL